MKTIRIFDIEKNINLARHAKTITLVSLILFIVAITLTCVLKINWGIDFTGGTEIQVKFENKTTAEDIRKELKKIKIKKSQVQTYGSNRNSGFLIKIKERTEIKKKNREDIEKILSESLNSKTIAISKKEGPKNHITLTASKKETLSKADIRAILDKNLKYLTLKDIKESGNNETITCYDLYFVDNVEKISDMLSLKFGPMKIERIDFIDTQASKKLREDGALAITYAIIAILIYLIARFDALLSPGAIIALMQDAAMSIFALSLFKIEFDLPSVAALLTVIGYSINNTIVIYDRIRENLENNKNKNLDLFQLHKCIDEAISGTLSRTINTTITTAISSITLLVLVGGPIIGFSTVLTVGILFGAFSSTLTAPMLYTVLKQRQINNNKNNIVKTENVTKIDKKRGVV